MSDLTLSNAYFHMDKTPTAVAEEWTRNAKAGHVLPARQAALNIQDAFNKDKRKGSIDAIGAISVYAYYEGITRRCLVEDQYPYGTQRAYPIFNKMVPAIAINPTPSSTPQIYMGLNKIYPKIGTIRTETQIPYIEMATLPQDPNPYVQRQAAWGLMKQEDVAFLTALESMISVYQTMSGTSANVYTTSGTAFTKEMFTAAESFLLNHLQKPSAIVMSAGDYGDIANMGLTQMGVLKTDEINEQFTITKWMGVDIILSPIVPQGTCYILPARENLGYMPTVGGICAMNDPSYTSQLINSVVYAEFMGIVIVNPYIVKLTKTVSNPYPNLVNPQPLGQIG